jgi:hypothetical protein
MIKTVFDTVALPIYAETCCRKREMYENAHACSKDGYENAMAKGQSQQRDDIISFLFEEPGRLNKDVWAGIVS